MSSVWEQARPSLAIAAHGEAFPVTRFPFIGAARSNDFGEPRSLCGSFLRHVSEYLAYVRLS
jgi:hypothetical protein